MSFLFKKVGGVFLLLLFGVLISSCAMYKPFMAPGFTGKDLTEGGLAIFPVLVGTGTTSNQNVGVQSYLRTTGGELATSIRKEIPSLRVVTPAQVSLVLAQNNLVEDFSKLKQTYAVTGIIDVKLAQKIVKPLHVRYFMLPSINALFAPDDSTAEAHIGVKIYDAKSAQMVFESVQTGLETSILGGPPYGDAIKDATEGIAQTLTMVYGQQ